MTQRIKSEADDTAPEPSQGALFDAIVDDEPIDDGFNPYGSGPVPIALREVEGV